MLPLAFAAALLALSLIPPVQQNPNLLWSFVGAAGVLLAWTVVLYEKSRRSERTLRLEVAFRKHHWVQACAQIGVFAWWGWYVAGVYAYVPLLVAQLLFAYGVESLLNWSRRDTHSLGFGPFPIILSINLFLWFKEDWFYWQFALIAVGYLGKELIRWNRDGRSRHIFNPSSFPLGLASLVLILLGATDITWGVEIATTQFNPPHMYLVIFLVALPGMLLFGVTSMTMAAVVTTYLFSLAYFKTTGTYYFFDSFIPLPVFLGMHLLFTDPSTSPRTESGRILFGIIYGLGTVACYALLSSAGLPRFYDKLLPVPIMNLMVRRIDILARSGSLRFLDPSGIGAALTPARRRIAYTSVWAGIFMVLSAVQGVGDRHPGQYFPFWEETCEAGNVRACDHVADMQIDFCGRGSGWACNEWAIYLVEHERPNRAMEWFDRACELGFEPGCTNAERAGAGRGTGVPTDLARGEPPLSELPIVARGSKGPMRESDPARVQALACERGWSEWCEDRSVETGLQ